MSRPEFLADAVSKMIADIYDCAVDPTRWEATLNNICKVQDLSYIQLYFWDKQNFATAGAPPPVTLQSTWDHEWFAKLPAVLPSAPRLDAWINADIDTPITQLELVPEQIVRQTEFYKEWVEPQGLRDSCITKILERPEVACMMTAASGMHRDIQGDRERNLIRLLSPHIRRSLLISDMVDKGKLQLELYQRLLDQLSAGVFLLDGDCRILHANSAANGSLSSSGPVGEMSGRLWPYAPAMREAFQNAVKRASLVRDENLETWGNGIALNGRAGEVAVAYILPLGRSERRHALGPGQVAVFITNKEGARPPAVEVLSAATGLSIAEARVALAIADGTAPEAAAQPLGISLNTFRKHLANIYGKTGLNSQSGLAAMVNRLRLPTI